MKVVRYAMQAREVRLLNMFVVLVVSVEKV